MKLAGLFENVSVARCVNLSPFLRGEVPHKPYISTFDKKEWNEIFIIEGWVDRFNEIYRDAVKENNTFGEFIERLKPYIFLKLHPSKNGYETAYAKRSRINEKVFRIGISVPQDIHLINLKFSELPQKFLTILRHEVAHTKQSTLLDKNYMSEPGSSQEFLNTLKALEYLTQPKERGPMSLDFAQELVENGKTPENMEIFLNNLIQQSKKIEQSKVKVFLQNQMNEFIPTSSVENLTVFLNRYAYLKIMLLQKQTIGQETLEKMKRIEKQSRFLIQLVKKNFKRVKAYYHHTK